MLYWNSFMGETSKQVKATLMLFKALLLRDWETMPPSPASPIPVNGALPCFARATLQDLECLTLKRTKQPHLCILMYAQNLTINLSFIY